MDALSLGLRWTIGGVFATLVVGSSACATLRRVNPRLDLGEVATRIRSWWVMVIAFSGALVIHPRAGIAFLFLVSIGAAIELGRLARVSPVPLLALSAALHLWMAAGLARLPLLLGPAVVLAHAGYAAWRGPVAGYLRLVGGTALGVVLVTALAHAAAVLLLPVAAVHPGGGAGLLVMLVVITQGADVAAFLTGRLYGSRPIAPEVSPHKTAEGLAGGLAVAVLLGLILSRLLTNFTPIAGAAIGLATGVAGFLGDLVVSALKRDAGVKDAGRLIPGHGGILDRVDSLLLAAPLFYLLVSLG